MADFEPKIVAFLCNWCTYTGADLAGTSRLQYPPNVRIIRLMCSGAVDIIYILKALIEGVTEYLSVDAIREIAITRMETTRRGDGLQF